MAFVNIANLAGADPTDPEPLDRLESRNGNVHATDASGLSAKPTLSEYRYWARIKRQTERDGTSLNGCSPDGKMITHRSPFAFLKNKGKVPAEENVQTGATVPAQELDEKGQKLRGENGGTVVREVDAMDDQFRGMTPAQLEGAAMRRQMRVASWSMMFFLITTDILGPFNAPYAIAGLGLIPGIFCYVFFGFIASGTAFMLGHLFCKLDSDRYPIRTFGDIAERIGGPIFKYICAILQSLQLVINVGLICLSSGQSLYQISKTHLCLSVAVVIWALVGMCVGQIRSLRNFSLIAQSAVFINITILIVSMAVVGATGPNKDVANAADATVGYGPVEVVKFATGSLESQINGMFNLVFAYGGAMIFPEMISEMRDPMSFWKGMVCADSLIMVCYLFYGVFFYSYAGQYTQANAFQGLTPYWGQTLCNVLNMISGMIAACLYGNIGVKVIYVNVIQDLFHGPQINSRKGRILWTVSIPCYWALSFVIANSIPALGAMTGLVGAVCIFQFSYTFPPLLLLMYKLQVHGASADVPYTGFGSAPRAIDSYKSMARWTRACLGTYKPEEDGPTELPRSVQQQGHSKMVQILFKVFLVGLTLACFACMGLGLYGTGESIAAAFEVGQASAFGCKANA